MLHSSLGIYFSENSGSVMSPYSRNTTPALSSCACAFGVRNTERNARSCKLDNWQTSLWVKISFNLSALMVDTALRTSDFHIISFFSRA